MTGRARRRVAHAGFLALLVVYSLFPIYFMLVQSLKTPQEDVFGHPLIVLHPTLDNFRELFGHEGAREGALIGGGLLRTYPFLEWLRNTLLVYGGSVLLTLVVAVMAGYAIGRLRPPGWRWWRRLLFATYAIPHTILFIPLYRIVIGLGLDDSLLVLLLVYPMLALPFCVWLLSSFWEHVPREIEDQALVDGATRASAFLRVILPMSGAVLVAAGIFTLGTIASDLMLASVFLLDPHSQTIPAGLGSMDVSLEELPAVAGVNLTAIPIALACAAFVRVYVRGLTAALVEGA
jgi:multiple sugar transport system permease protein